LGCQRQFNKEDGSFAQLAFDIYPAAMLGYYPVTDAQAQSEIVLFYPYRVLTKVFSSAKMLTIVLLCGKKLILPRVFFGNLFAKILKY